MDQAKALRLSVEEIVAMEHFEENKEELEEMIYTHPHTKLEGLRGKIASISMEQIRMAVIQDEISLLESRLEPHDTGHLHTAIGVLSHRLKELKNH